MARREIRRRKTKSISEKLLLDLISWAKSDTEVRIRLDEVAQDGMIPEGSLAHHMEHPEACHALACASGKPEILLPLLFAYQRYENTGGDQTKDESRNV